MNKKNELINLIKIICNDDDDRECLLNAVEDYTDKEVEEKIKFLREFKSPII